MLKCIHMPVPLERRYKQTWILPRKRKQMADNSRWIILFWALNFTVVNFSLLCYLIREMHPLLGKTLIRVTLFYAYGLFVAWIFTLIERTEESAHDRMKQKLRELRTEIDLKYNITMTDNDFDIFVQRAAAAVATDAELDWTFLNSCGFAFAAITTIGKVLYDV